MDLQIFTCQQGSGDWIAARLGIPTASEFATILQKGRGGGESVGRRAYMLKLIGERLTGQPTIAFSNEHTERGHEMESEARDLYQMVTDLEPDMQFVFSKIGKSDTALYAERLVWFVHTKGKVPYHEAYRYVHSYFPSMRDFEDILAGCVRAGYVKLEQCGSTVMISPGIPLITTSEKKARPDLKEVA